MKFFLLLPSLIFLLLSFILFFANDLFLAGAWFIVAVIFFIIIFPLAIDMEEKLAPIFQIFSSLFLFIIVFSYLATKDFLTAGEPQGNALIYGIGIGAGTMAIIMFAKGKK